MKISTGDNLLSHLLRNLLGLFLVKLEALLEQYMLQTHPVEFNFNQMYNNKN